MDVVLVMYSVMSGRGVSDEGKGIVSDHLRLLPHQDEAHQPGVPPHSAPASEHEVLELSSASSRVVKEEEHEAVLMLVASSYLLAEELREKRNFLQCAPSSSAYRALSGSASSSKSPFSFVM